MRDVPVQAPGASTRPLPSTARRRWEASLDTIFAVRPLLWVPAVAVYGAGWAWGKGTAPAHGAGTALPALLLLLGAVHAVNAWRDRAGDDRNRKGFPVVRGRARRGSLAGLGLFCLLAGGALAARSDALERALLGGSLLLGAAYVIPPVELKRRAALDLLSHAAGYGGIAFLLGAAGAGTLDGREALIRAAQASIPYALGIAAVSLLTMIADAPGDAAVGQRTSAVQIGPDRAARAALALAWGTAAVGLWAGALVPILWGSLAAALLTLQGSGPRPTRVWNGLAIRLQLVFLALLAPWNALPLGFTVAAGALTEAYNRWRWGIGYPLRGVWSAERGGVNSISE